MVLHLWVQYRDLIRLFAALFGRLLGRWRGAIAALACIATYTVLVGAGACVVRAALMGELNTLAIVALVSLSAGDQQWRLDSEPLQGYTLLRTDRSGGLS